MFTLKLNKTQFLNDTWQQKPVVIKQGFPEFQDPISPEEIAGLAMEDEVESRLVFKEQDQWQAELGPFKTFERLDSDGATLLIQAVDHWHEKAQMLVRPFRFIPNRRIDDLMISYSTPQGGVGPHIDQYDVFIIQGKGRRHWRVGDKLLLNEFAAHAALKHCEPFDAIIDVVLEPGDILYIPCGFPHEGYAVDASLNYSVGFRAPDQNELLSGIADFLIDSDEQPKRYQDNSLIASEQPGEIKTQELNALHKLMFEKFKQPAALIPWFGKMITEAKHDLDIAEERDELSLDELLVELKEGSVFRRLGGLRAVYFEEALDDFFVNGEHFLCKNFSNVARLLCDHDETNAEFNQQILDNAEALELFVQLINKGYWYLC